MWRHSGFHALISSGTTPKLLRNEADIRLVGYGAMALESFVAIMAMIAAALLDPGVYFAINSPLAALGGTPAAAVATLTGWGFPVTLETMQRLAHDVGEASLFARTGGAPSLAVGMASVLAGVFGRTLLAVWYHFAIMFEAVFILTTVDAGTRAGRFMVQYALGLAYAPLGRTSSLRSTLVSSTLVVGAWGYFLYVGVIDPNGGINMLWPLFGISNQMLAAIALAVASVILARGERPWRAIMTAIPLSWLAAVTTAAAWLKLTSPDPKIGFLAAANDVASHLAAGTLAPEKVAIAGRLIFNQRLDAALTLLFVVLLLLVILDALYSIVTRRSPGLFHSTETPYVRSRLPEALDANA